MDADGTQLGATAVDEGAQLFLDELGDWTVGLGAPGEERLEVLAYGSMQDGLLGLAWLIDVDGGCDAGHDGGAVHAGGQCTSSSVAA